MVSHALILLAAISLVPPFLNTALQPRPATFLWVSPLFFLLWSLLLAFLYLAACYLLDARRAAKPKVYKTLPRLAFLSPASWSAQTSRLKWAQSSSAPLHPPIYPPSPQLSAAFDQLIHLVIRDFVLKWHTPLSTGSNEPPLDQLAPEFAQAIEATIRTAVQSLQSLLKRLDAADFVMRKLVPKLTAHLDSYRRAEFDFRGTSDSDAHLSSFGSDQIDLFLANEYQNGHLHSAVGDMSSLHTKPAEQAFLRQTATRLLEAVLPYPESQSRSVNIVVREILSCTILFPVMDMISDPDFWNNLLEQKAGAVLHEQVLVSKLREALDKQDPASASPSTLSRPQTGGAGETGSLLHWPGQDSKRPDQRSFDAFLQSIRTTVSLLEARRTRNDIAIQIHKTKTNLERLPEAAASKAPRSKLQSYLARLETAYALADAKVLELGSNKGIQLSHNGIVTAPGGDPNISRARLQHVLLNPSSLSFFMEFMDRRKRSILVQFWLIVESFKTPLEVADLDADPKTEREQLLRASRSPPPSKVAIKILREDLVMFDTIYYSSPAIDITQRWVDSARQFVKDADKGVEVTALQVWHVRRDVLKAQRQILQEMEDQDWPAFKKSDLFLKAVQDLRPDADLAAGLASSVTLPVHVTSSVESLGETQTRILAKTGNVLEHADLFGTDLPLNQGQGSKQVVDLFGDRLAGSRSKASSKAGNLDILIGGRTQHAGPDGRTPLFREDPLFDEADDEAHQNKHEAVSGFYQTEKMEEIQSALQDIIDEDIDRTLTGVSTSSNAMAGSRKVSDQSVDLRAKRSLEPVEISERQGSLTASAPSTSEKAPSLMPSSGNLNQDIASMKEKLDKLVSQAEILDALIRKAELTGARAGELRLLIQSSHAVRREARELRWQSDILEKQRADSRLVAGQTKVAITDTMISLDQEGKEYAVYLIEVSLRKSDEQGSASGTPTTRTNSSAAVVARGWIVGRRYSEFWSLHQALKDKFAEVRTLESEFPGKRLVGLVHAPFVDARKANLEKYLQALIKLPMVCDSEELRLFLAQSPAGTRYLTKKPSEALLSPLLAETPLAGFFAGANNKFSAQGFPGRDLVKTLFKGMSGVAEGLDELIGIGPSMLDVTLQRLAAQVQSKSSTTPSAGRSGAEAGGYPILTGIADIDMVSQAMSSSASAAELREAAGAGTTPLTEPICDLFVSLFELKENASNSNWLRRQAIVILLQQLFGSTVERKVRETFAALLSPPSLCNYIAALQNGLWPGGQLKQPTPPRTSAEKELLRENANRKLSSLIPELASNIVGRENARRGTRRIFSALQNKRLNKHIFYTMLDMSIDELLSHAAPT